MKEQVGFSALRIDYPGMTKRRGGTGHESRSIGSYAVAMPDLVKQCTVRTANREIFVKHTKTTRHAWSPVEGKYRIDHILHCSKYRTDSLVCSNRLFASSHTMCM